MKPIQETQIPHWYATAMRGSHEWFCTTCGVKVGSTVTAAEGELVPMLTALMRAHEMQEQGAQIQPSPPPEQQMTLFEVAS